MKYAVITGSTKGIGKAIAEKLLENNWYVILNYASDDYGAQCFIEEHQKYKEKFKIIKADLSAKENVGLFVEKVLAITDSVDCLVLNAGKTYRADFDDIDYLEWEKVIDTNLNASFFLVHSFRNNISPNTGRIVFIGSIMGIYPHSMSIAYGVTKSAVHHLAKSLTKYFSPKGITVNAIAPGFIDTPWQLTKPKEQRRRIEDKTALHRFGLPAEIAGLCFEIINNQFINGSVLTIDGGYSFA